MAVREGFLVLLLAGDHYGFRLHSEWIRRTGGRRQLNVGQSYATIDRLQAAGLVETRGATEDGLELFGLSDSGTQAALAWLSGAHSPGANPWDESVERVLLTLSLPALHPDITAESLLDAEAERWRHAALSMTDADAVAVEAALAHNAQAAAMIDWLHALGERYRHSPDTYALEFSTERPRRGRPRSRSSTAS